MRRILRAPNVICDLLVAKYNESHWRHLEDDWWFLRHPKCRWIKLPKTFIWIRKQFPEIVEEFSSLSRSGEIKNWATIDDASENETTRSAVENLHTVCTIKTTLAASASVTRNAVIYHWLADKSKFAEYRGKRRKGKGIVKYAGKERNCNFRSPLLRECVMFINAIIRDKH